MIEPVDTHRRDQERRLREAWRQPTGWRYWSAVNNTVVGLWYIAVTFLFFLFGGVLALLMRWQLARPDNDFLSADRYNQIFTLHGSVMMFLFAIPIFESVSILFLPAMIGARELPFPRISAFGFWAFTIGGVFLCGSLFFDAAPQGGWFMYPPLTSRYQPGIGADIWLLGFSFIEVAAIAAAVELIVGVLRCRAPGMRLNLIPLYAWYVLVAGVMVVFAFPPLIAGTILLELERAFGWPFFDAAGGGDPLLWQHLFWIFGHPEVYIIFLPSVALIAMIVPDRGAAADRRLQLDRAGRDRHRLPELRVVGPPHVHDRPAGRDAGDLLRRVDGGRDPDRHPDLLLHRHAAGRHRRPIGADALHHRRPVDIRDRRPHRGDGGDGAVQFPGARHLFRGRASAHGADRRRGVPGGRRASTTTTRSRSASCCPSGSGRVSFWLVFVGFNATFLPMHLTGLMGLPRRVFTYPAGLGLEPLNLLSTVGAFVLAAGFAVVAWDVLRPKSRQPYAPRNPWNAGSVEWLQEIPGEPWGVRTIPRVERRYPLWETAELPARLRCRRFFLPDAEEGRREMLVTSSIDAEPLQCMRIPGPTFITLFAAIAVGGIFIFPTFKMYSMMGVSAALSLVAIVIWLWTGTGEIPEKDTQADRPRRHGCRSTLSGRALGRAGGRWASRCSRFSARSSAWSSATSSTGRCARTSFRPTRASTPLGGRSRWSAPCSRGRPTVLARRWNADNRAAAFYGGSLFGVVTAVDAAAPPCSRIRTSRTSIPPPACIPP